MVNPVQLFWWISPYRGFWYRYANLQERLLDVADSWKGVFPHKWNILLSSTAVVFQVLSGCFISHQCTDMTCTNDGIMHTSPGNSWTANCPVTFGFLKMVNYKYKCLHFLYSLSSLNVNTLTSTEVVSRAKIKKNRMENTCYLYSYYCRPDLLLRCWRGACQVRSVIFK